MWHTQNAFENNGLYVCRGGKFGVVPAVAIAVQDSREDQGNGRVVNCGRMSKTVEKLSARAALSTSCGLSSGVASGTRGIPHRNTSVFHRCS